MGGRADDHGRDPPCVQSSGAETAVACPHISASPAGDGVKPLRITVRARRLFRGDRCCFPTAALAAPVVPPSAPTPAAPPLVPMPAAALSGTAASQFPRRLPLNTPKIAASHCAGINDLVPDILPNCYPVWKRRDGEFYVFGSQEVELWSAAQSKLSVASCAMRARSRAPQRTMASCRITIASVGSSAMARSGTRLRRSISALFPYQFEGRHYQSIGQRHR